MSNSDQYIALVDAEDQIVGYEEKMKVHEDGMLHRAFSAFVFNAEGKMLLQKRAQSKYHSPGLWTNTCCSHLSPDLSMEACVHDRMQFEMGFDCEVDYKFKFTYKIAFGNGLTEYETDHVYFAKWDGIPKPNPDEVGDYKWVSTDWLLADIKANPDNYTYWFKYIMEHFPEKF